MSKCGRGLAIPCLFFSCFMLSEAAVAADVFPDYDVEAICILAVTAGKPYSSLEFDRCLNNIQHGSRDLALSHWQKASDDERAHCLRVASVVNDGYPALALCLKSQANDGKDLERTLLQAP